MTPTVTHRRALSLAALAFSALLLACWAEAGGLEPGEAAAPGGREKPSPAPTRTVHFPTPLPRPPIPAETWPPPAPLDLPAEPGSVPEPTFPPPSEETGMGILGKKVRGPTNEDMGLVIDVVVDRRGDPLAAVIDFGGFLGVGSRKIAVAWSALQFDPGQTETPVRLAVGRAEVQAAPEYKPNLPIKDVVGWPAPGATPAGAGK